MTRRSLRCAVILATALAVGTTLPAEQPTTAPTQPAATIKDSLKELRRASLTAPASDGTAADLQRAIRSVSAVQVRPKTTDPTPTESALQPATGPAQTQPTSAPTVGRLVLASRPASAPVGISPQTLEQLKKAAPKGLASPLELADTLLAAGEMEAADVFYSQALQQEQPDENKAWTLFQIANCRRGKDPAAAKALYRKLQDEQPNSPWSIVAGAQVQLIDWQLTNKPGAVLSDVDNPNRKVAPPATPAIASGENR
jgi:hypothetical protein